MRRGRSARAPRAVAFTGCLLVILLYALRGGAYDSVVFQEHALVVWWIIALGFALGLLPRVRPPRAVLALIAAILAYAAWTALSLVWTQSSERTTEELARVLGYAGLIVLFACSVDRRTWRAAAAGLATGALVVCVLAVGSRLDPSVFPVDYVDATFGIDRLTYPFGYWNAVAAWAAMAMAIGLAWSAHDSVKPRRAVALALVPVAATADYFSYSRAGVGGAGVAVIAVLAFSRNRITALLHTAVAGAGAALAIAAVRGAPQVAHATGTHGASKVFVVLLVAAAACAATALATAVLKVDTIRVPRTVARPLAAVAAVVLLVAAGAFGPHLVRRGWHSFTRTTMTSAADPSARLGSLSGSRYPLWKATANGWSAHPLDGTGAGTFEFFWNQHATNPEFVRNTHNIWLQNLLELGLPGLLLIIAVAAAALTVTVNVRRKARRSVSCGASCAVLAAFLVFLVHASVDWMWESTAVTVLALAGVAVVGARGSSRAVRVSLAPRAALALVATVAALVQFPGLLSTVSLRRSQAAARSGDAAAALAWAKEAVQAEPWSASAYQQRGLVLEADGRTGAAAQDLQRAIDHEPTDFRHWLLLARVDTERGQLRRAAAASRRAHTLRPSARVFALAPYFAGTEGG